MATAGQVAGYTAGATNATRTVGAFAASAGIHALILAAIGTLLVTHGAAPAASAWSAPLTAVLVSPASEAAPAPLPARPAPRPVPVVVPKPAPVPEALPEPPKPSRYVVPWAHLPARVDAPEWLFDRPMVADGVALMETRNVVLLGEDIERRIQRDFPVEPVHPVVLRSPDQLGYPLEALEAGVEGRVVVWMGVDETGKVVDAAMLDGPPILIEWVASRLGRLIEKPARDKQGDPMPGWVAVEIDFTRETAAQAAAARGLASAPLR